MQTTTAQARTIAMHRDPVADFEHFRPGDRINWHHGPTNRRQTGTIVAWTPEYRVNAVGKIICLRGVAVINVEHLGFTNWQGWPDDKRDVQVMETFTRYGSGIAMVYR